MIEKNITIINKLGLHARAAAKFVARAGKFSSDVEILRGDQTICGKSIMGVMMLAASKGTEILLRVDGPDELEAMTSLVELINERFGESE